MLLDSSIIIEIFRKEKKTKTFEEIFNLIKDDTIFISIIQIGEIADWCIKNKINPEERIEKLKQILNVVPLNEKICIEGAKIKHYIRKKETNKFSLIDGIILSSSRSINQKLLTMDKDFRNIEDTIVLN
jgi:predicted nucleic acid-binding protein